MVALDSSRQDISAGASLGVYTIIPDVERTGFEIRPRGGCYLNTRVLVLHGNR